MDLEEFSVATFNVFNLQDPGEKMNPRQRPWTKKQFIDKANWTVFQLVTLGLPHIVGLQEVWSKQALEKVLATGEEEEHHLKAHVRHAGDARGRHLHHLRGPCA